MNSIPLAPSGAGHKAVAKRLRPLFFSMRTFIYIDGFNLYYGALKDTPYKWLNLDTLCRLLLAQHHTIDRIKYFTARVSARPDDPDQPTRQQIYFRALHTIPHLDIILGHFLTSHVRMRLVHPPPHGPRTAEVIKTEEKGSDVNLASHLLSDGYRGFYEAAVLITNDSDLLEPVRMVRQQLGLPIGILNPHPQASRVLVQQATFVRQIRPRVLRASQFPNPMTDARGIFHKPASW
jgi:NYN domain